MAAKKKQGKTAAKGDALKILNPVRVLLAELHFATYNPRVMPREKMEALEASIEEHGVVQSFVLQRRSEDGTTNVVIAGHQRTTAIRNVCKRRKWPVPDHGWAYVLDVDDRTAKRLNVALNNIEGEFDPLKLGELLRSVNDIAPIGDVEALGMGLQLGQVGELLKIGGVPLAPTGGGQKLTTFAKAPTLSIEFDTAEQRDAVRDRLAEAIRGKKDLKAGSIVSAALSVYRP